MGADSIRRHVPEPETERLRSTPDKTAEHRIALAARAVPKAEQEEIFAIIDSTKSDIVLPVSTTRP
jgi:hypothetical protein